MPADQAKRWEATEAVVHAMPREKLDAFRGVLSQGTPTLDALNEVAAAAGAWAEASMPSPPRMDADASLEEIRAAYFEATDMVLPNSYDARGVARTAFLVAHDRLRSGDTEGGRAWIEFGVGVLVRLGRSPTMLERMSALKEFDRWFSTVDALGLDALKGEIERAWRGVDEESAVAALDVPGSIAFGGAWYGYLLAVRPQMFSKENGFELPMFVNKRVLGEEVERVLREMAAVYDEADAELTLRPIRDGFQFQGCEEFISGYDRKYTEVEAARDRLRRLRGGG